MKGKGKANEMENGKIERSTILKKKERKKELKTKEAIYIYIYKPLFNIQHSIFNEN